MIIHCEWMFVVDMILQRLSMVFQFSPTNAACNLITDDFKQAVECSPVVFQLAAVTSLVMIGCAAAVNYV